MAVQNINYIELKNCVVDELHLRERTDTFVNLSPARDDWQIDTYLLAQFLGNLEAGSIVNNGLEIIKFAVRRRKISEITNTTLGCVSFINGTIHEYVDNTQANEEYVYTIVPISENSLEGNYNIVQLQSDFTGWWVVDKTDLSNMLACDKFSDSEPEVVTQLNQGRVILETLNRFPQVYYTEKAYHSFTLTAMIPVEPEQNNNTFKEYKKLLAMVNSRKPYIAKSGSGDIYVVELSNPVKITPLNSGADRDYMLVEFDCTEIMSEEEYHKLYQVVS